MITPGHPRKLPRERGWPGLIERTSGTMPIKAIPGPGGTIRDLQARLAEVGRIRTGTFNGKYPEKLDRFRFTSPDQALITHVAAAYGGTPTPWTPQGGSGQQWEVITDADRVPVYIPPQHIDPWNELWAAGRTCVRRCDGEREIIKDEPCVCATGKITDARQLCKPTVRVQLMLAEVPGIGSWRLESHGTYAVSQMSMLAPLVRAVPMPLPAFLVLKAESGRRWNAEKSKFDTRQWYVPQLHISAVSAQQITMGGDALTQALTAAGAPTALSAGPVREIEAAPAPVAGELLDGELDRILIAIEKAATPAALKAIQTGLMDRGIDHPAVVGAWQSKATALTTAAQLEHQASLKRAVDQATTQPEQAHQKAAQPCTDPFCGGDKGGCGWTVKEHQDFHGKDLIKNMPLGLPTVTPAVRAGEDVIDAEIVELPTEQPQRTAAGNLAGARAALIAAAAPLGWTTAEVLQKLADHARIESGMKATVAQLVDFRQAIERGIVQ